MNSYLPFSFDQASVSVGSFVVCSDSAIVPVAIIGFIVSGFPIPHLGITTNAQRTNEKPRKANTSGWRIQTP
jgi:hypothetical protein